MARLDKKPSIQEKIICGIQQIGIGVSDLEAAWAWYRKHFGMDIPVFKDSGEASLMTSYTGGRVHSRSAVLAMNLLGGGGFEIWQYTSRTPQPPQNKPELGERGIFICRIKSPDVRAVYSIFSERGANLLGEPVVDPGGEEHFFIEDPFGNIFQIVEGSDWFSRPKGKTGGVAGCMIGVSHIEKSLPLYTEILNYDKIIYDEEGVFADLEPLPGGNRRVRRVLLTHSERRRGSFSNILGSSKIELIELKEGRGNRIFENRQWGDLGYIHLCFDVKGMDALERECAERGYPFTVKSKGAFEMGNASGQFAYIEDPDGTLIELVETYRIPIVKSLGLYLDIKKLKPQDPVPNWILKALRLSRVKD